ncbi:hypothetical protein MTBPR1_10092 [Candidatus Terasakiella magnetica]|uniref:Uncharacterized protein n=1 Tax=Candidatus Terasakiella magnetica TaxID=1867952 RepID=A0A1C3RC51_9PROT|nr:hypothetical protein [Candidatus Terasakiella magnetica]SCA54845.1 hypothetical protein MTBPR1_10092 [Candidatus Terasakiella magnetica]
MSGDDHIKKLLQEGLGKFNMEDQLDKKTDPRTQAPDEVPSFDELGYDYETNPVLKKRVEEEIKELKKKDGIE